MRIFLRRGEEDEGRNGYGVIEAGICGVDMFGFLGFGMV
jgi:hypothetical protein